MMNFGTAKSLNAACATKVKMNLKLIFRCMLANKQKVILHASHASRDGAKLIMNQILESEWKIQML